MPEIPSEKPENEQPREGRWLDETRWLSEKELREPLPHGDLSLEDLYNESFGPRGDNWDLIAEGEVSDKAREQDELTAIESRMAVDALNETIVFGKPTADLPLENRATHGPVGRIQVYPAGDEYFKETNESED